MRRSEAHEMGGIEPCATELGRSDNQKIVLGTGRLGYCAVAVEGITAGEFIAGFYGRIYVAKLASKLPPEAINHAIQFSHHLWRDSHGIAKFLNHSCSPNCTIDGSFDLVALHDIRPGEELTWDYSTTEDSDWTVPGGKCLCMTPGCRGDIHPYSRLADSVKASIGGRLGSWILSRENLTSRKSLSTVEREE